MRNRKKEFNDQINIRLPKKLREEVFKYAEENNQAVSKKVREFLESYKNGEIK